MATSRRNQPALALRVRRAPRAREEADAILLQPCRPEREWSATPAITWLPRSSDPRRRTPDSTRLPQPRRRCGTAPTHPPPGGTRQVGHDPSIRRPVYVWRVQDGRDISDLYRLVASTPEETVKCRFRSAPMLLRCLHRYLW